MRLPDGPYVGLVLSYSYLRADDAKRGAEEGRKTRPAVIVLARRDMAPREVVYVVPITHSPPARRGDKIEIPHGVKKRLGLDDRASWIDATEVNIFVWPGPDLRPTGDSHAGDDASCFYGFLPRGSFKQIKAALEENRRLGRLRSAKRQG